jgi:hypothetical protein
MARSDSPIVTRFAGEGNAIPGPEITHLQVFIRVTRVSAELGRAGRRQFRPVLAFNPADTMLVLVERGGAMLATRRDN